MESSIGSPIDILIIALIFVLLFGGSKLAGLGKGLGQGIRNFKSSVKDEEAPEKEKRLEE